MTEERLALLERAQQGDDEACRQMLTENAGLIWSIVKRYHHCGVEMDDLYQLGCIGFIKAVKGFDLTYGTQFSTYAVPKIAGEIRRFLRDDGPIKVGRTLREKGQMLWTARERLQNRLGCAPKLSELAEETGLTVEEIANIELAVVAPESLQQETADGLTLESLDETLENAYQAGQKAFGFYTGGESFTLLTLRDEAVMDAALPELSPASRHLDVNVLHTLILERRLGIDKRNMAAGVNLTYTRSLREALDDVEAGAYQAAFLLNPTRVEEIRDVAAAGEKMPQKSTYFYPKLITGLTMNRLR